MKYLIIGGVAGGATTAARLRRVDEKSEIIIFERGEYISYANCGLPYYIGGTIPERENLFVQTPETFGQRFNLEVRNFSELEQVLKVGKVHRIMLDNFTPQDLKRAVEIINGKYETEASGGINLQTIRSFAETGVDYISVGALTHQIKSLDLSLIAIK